MAACGWTRQYASRPISIHPPVDLNAPIASQLDPVAWSYGRGNASQSRRSRNASRALATHTRCRSRLRGRANAQIAEMTVGAVVYIEADAAVRVCAALQVVDDQDRLRRVADKQLRGRAFDVDAHQGPFAWHQIDIGLVLRRRLAAQPVEVVA